MNFDPLWTAPLDNCYAKRFVPRARVPTLKNSPVFIPVETSVDWPIMKFVRETRPIRVLMCEDSQDDAFFCENALREANLNVALKHVSKRPEFEAQVREGSWDVVLIDYYLPGYSGESALHFCREIAPELPLIFVSGTINEEQAIEALKLGATDYVLKHRLSRLAPAVARAFEEVCARREQIATARRLQETELFLQTAMEVGQIGSWSSSLRGDSSLAWSRGTHRIFGLDADAAPSREFFYRMVHPEDLHLVTEAVDKAISTRGNYNVDHRIQRADGVARWVHEQGRVLCDEAGRPVKLVGVVQDITERKEAEEKIREQAELLDVAQSAIITHNLEGQIQFWNRSAEQLYGWTAAEAVGVDVRENLYAGSGDLFADIRRKTLESGSWHGEITHRCKDGRLVACDSRWSVVRDASGRLRSILSVNTDLTERKRLEQQFLRAQRMECVGALASGIAHDINNVLAPVLMSVEIFRDKLKDPEDRELLDTLETSAKRGADIVRQVLTFARGSEGQRAPIQLRRAITDIVKIIRETFPRSITAVGRIPDSLWTVRGDATHLYQVLMNLCVNARDAMPSGGELIVTAENVALDDHATMFHDDARPGHYVRISVKDSGVGMTREVQERMFDPFFTTKEIGRGTGLGLSTVANLVRGYNGFITVDSSPGQGTEMRIYLPAEKKIALDEDDGAGEMLEGGRGQLIMVVDDEATIRVVTRTTLEANGYSVITATDGMEAVAIFPKEPGKVKVVVTDLMMPSMDGAATINALRERDPGLRFIAVSGLMDPTKLPDLGPGNPIGFLQKPFTAERLLRLLGETLRR